MTNNNYVTILGWMTELGLKPTELIVYSIIYGFSQDKESYFHGSISYLTQWTGTTNECVIYTLKSLVEKGLLKKIVRDGRTNLYQTINPLEKVETVEVEKTEDKVEEVKETKQDPYKEIVDKIVTYLNNKLGSRYRTSNSTTYKLIVSKLKSGYTYEDCIKVIDTKYSDWHNNPDMSKYLRPSTLFGNKFENYVNQPSYKPKQDYRINKYYTIDTNTTDNFINNNPNVNKVLTSAVDKTMIF